MRAKHALNTKRIGLICLITVIVSVFSMVGCTTVPSKEAIPPFRQGVITAEAQTNDAFLDVNRFLRQQQIEHAIHQRALTEDLFFGVIDAPDMAKWNRAFGYIDSYAAQLERLVSPDQRSGVEGELAELGTKIEGVPADQIPAGISAAFNKFGGLLVAMKGEQDALAAMRRADPAIQDIFSAMMEAIGEDSTSGLRGTVRTSWNQVLARIDVVQFRQAPNENAKRKAVENYLKTLDERELQDQLLGSLRLSLATLAKAHQEMARGQRLSAAGLIQFVQDEYKAYRQQVEAIQARRQEAAGDGGVE